MWKEEIKDVLWSNYNFLDNKFIDDVLSFNLNSNIIDIEQKYTNY